MPQVLCPVVVGRDEELVALRAALDSALSGSFYVLEGEMIIRFGDHVSLGTPGTWVPFPRGVPHTFRVMAGTARVLIVQANHRFMRAVRGIGRPAAGHDPPASGDGPSPDEPARAMAAHDITAMGPPMEEDEAQSRRHALATEALDLTP
jgi:hypothetical protein